MLDFEDCHYPCDSFLHCLNGGFRVHSKSQYFCEQTIVSCNKPVLWSEIPSSKFAKHHTVAARNNTDYPTRSLSLSPLATTVNCSSGSQALLLEVTHEDHSITACPHHIYTGVILRTHSICGELHIQHNAKREVTTPTIAMSSACGSVSS